MIKDSSLLKLGKAYSYGMGIPTNDPIILHTHSTWPEGRRIRIISIGMNSNWYSDRELLEGLKGSVGKTHITLDSLPKGFERREYRGTTDFISPDQICISSFAFEVLNDDPDGNY